MSLGRGCLAGILLLIASTPAAQSHSRESEIKRIVRSLAQSGPAVTLKRYFDCDNGPGWDLVSSGDPRAVKIAFAVMPAADACYAEIMAIVLGQALSNNPKLMLSYYPKYPKAFAEWCVPGLIDPTAAEWTAAVDKAERAIRSVHDPALEEAKQICLAEVARARRMPPG